MTRSTSLAVLALLALTHVLLASLFAINTPYRQAGAVVSGGGYAKDIGAPDERQHANYIAWLMDKGTLPILNPKDPSLYEHYQAHQAPLYYVVALGWHRTLETVGLAKHVTDQLPNDSEDHPGLATKQIPDGFPTRFLNVLIGALTVVGVAALGWWAYRSKPIALAAAAFVALLPMNLALSGSISNDPLLICFCTWVIALLALSIRDGWTTRRAVAVALLSGLAILTKTTAVALLPTVLLAVWLSPQRPTAKQISVAAVVLLLLAVPWWIRNTMHYGDPLAVGIFKDAFKLSPHREMFVTQIIPQQQPGKDPNVAYWVDWVGFWTARSFIGVFGYMDIWLTQSGLPKSSFDENRLYWVLFILIGIALAGWLIGWKDKTLALLKPIWIVNLTFSLIILLLFIQFNLTYFQAQARYLFPALGPMVLAIAGGAAVLSRKRLWVPLAAITLLLLSVDAFALARIGPSFEQRIELGTHLKPQ